MQDLPGFFFAGAGTLPGFLLYAGDPGIAVLALVALFLAACVGGMAAPDAPFRTMPGPDDEKAPPRG